MTPETLLFRQIHPNFYKGGRILSVAFRPTPKDEGLLSVYDGDQITAQDSWQHYTGELNLRSAGTWAISVQEVEECALTARPEPEPYPEHAVVDFSQHQEAAQRAKAKLLAAKAEARLCQYEPPAPPAAAA